MSAIEAPRELAVTRHRLANGFTVLVNEDHKAPVVAMSLWYRVGSGHEPAGKHGFAHLFEHLMFSGSANVPDGYFNAFSESGARDLNGTTWVDRTNYFITVPLSALERALWVESDRMANLLSERSQEALDTQRGVISNEKLEGDGRPFGRLGQTLAATAYPEGHPYGHTTIGSMDDLSQANLRDVGDWYGCHYGAANATLALAGAISAGQAIELVDRHFGGIQPGPRPVHPGPWIPVPTSPRRVVCVEPVPHALVARQWNCPGWGHPDHPLLEMVTQILSAGAGTRLFERLVAGAGIATEVVARINRFCVTSPFGISAHCRAPKDVMRVEQILDEELKRLEIEGPTEREMALAASALMHGFSQSLEYVGGMGGQAAILAEGQCLRGDPASRWKDLEAMGRATPKELSGAVSRWLGRDSTTVVLLPQAADGDTGPRATSEHVTTDAADSSAWSRLSEGQLARVEWDEGLRANSGPLDRTAGMPRVMPSVEVRFPEVRSGRLTSGSTLHVARRSASPMVELAIVLPHGFGEEPRGEEGALRMGLSIALEGPSGSSFAAFQSRKKELGVSLWGGVSVAHTTVGCSGPISGFSRAVSMLLDVAQRPLLDDAAFHRYRRRWEATRRSTLGDPGRLVSSLLPSFVFGLGHPLGRRGGGNPTPDSIARLDRASIARALDRLRHPGEMAIFACGDVAAEDVGGVFGQQWTEEVVPTILTAANVGEPASCTRQVFVVDFPNARQVAIAGGLALPGLHGPEAMAWRLANDILGGSFEGRLNRNLRESKSWAYGAGSSISEFSGASMWSVTASVQADKGVDALLELEKELVEFGRERPPSEAEFERARTQRINALGGRYEAVSAVVGAMTGSYVGGDGLAALAEPIKALRATLLKHVRAAAASVHRSDVAWLLAGSAEVLVPELKKRMGTEIHVLRAEEYV